MKLQKIIILSLFIGIFLFTLDFQSLAKEDEPTIISVENYDVVEDVNELVELSKEQMKSKEENRLTKMVKTDDGVFVAEQPIQKRTYSDNSVEEDHIVSIVSAMRLDGQSEEFYETDIRDGYYATQHLYYTQYSDGEEGGWSGWKKSFHKAAAAVSQNSSPVDNLYQSIMISGAHRPGGVAVSQKRFSPITDATVYTIPSPDETPYDFSSINNIFLDLKMEVVAKNGRRGVVIGKLNQGGIGWQVTRQVYNN